MAVGAIKETIKDPRIPQRKFEDDAEDYLRERYPNFEITPQHRSKTGKSMTKR